MKVGRNKVLAALDELEKSLEGETGLSKASGEGLDQPEGDPIDPVQKKNKMSDAAPGPDAKKSYGEDEDEEDGESGEEMQMSKKSKKAKKSFAEGMDNEVKAKIEVSEFLKSLVDHTGKSIDGLSAQISKSMGGVAELAEQVAEIHKSQAKIGVVLKALCEETGVIQKSAANAPKAQTTAPIAKSQVAERTFDNPRTETASNEGEKMFKSLSSDPRIAKSQISDAMCDLVYKGEAKDTDVIGFETSGYISPAIASKLNETLN